MEIQRIFWSLVPVMLVFLPGCKEGQTGSRNTPGSSGANEPTSALNLRVLLPPNECVLPAPLLRVLAVTDVADSQTSLTLDGKLLDFERMAVGTLSSGSTQPATQASDASSEVAKAAHTPRQAVLFAETSLAPGEHRITVGNRQMRVFVKGAGADAPADWPVYRLHPPNMPGRSDICSACHQITEADQGRILGSPRVPDACFECHKLEDFELIHMHRVESLVNCHMCHEPHGSSAEMRLKGDPEELCTKCHE